MTVRYMNDQDDLAVLTFDKKLVLLLIELKNLNIIIHLGPSYYYGKAFFIIFIIMKRLFLTEPKY